MARASSRPKSPATFRVQACGHTYRAAGCKICPHCFGMRAPVPGQSNDNIEDKTDA